MTVNYDKKNSLETEGSSKKPPQPIVEDDDVKETGGPLGPEPTRYGDWERKGRCVDF